MVRSDHVQSLVTCSAVSGAGREAMSELGETLDEAVNDVLEALRVLGRDVDLAIRALLRRTRRKAGKKDA